MYRILIIDDEPNVLSALRRCLSAIDAAMLGGREVSIETFTSPLAAIERAEEQDFDLLMSDYRMPVMNGVEVLGRLMETHPRAPRVIISGYADRDAIIAAINEVNLTRFIEKPWNDQQLRNTIASILRQADLSGAGNRPGPIDSSAVSDRHLKRLEKESPGITRVEHDEYGGIVISSRSRND